MRISYELITNELPSSEFEEFKGLAQKLVVKPPVYAVCHKEDEIHGVDDIAETLEGKLLLAAIGKLMCQPNYSSKTSEQIIEILNKIAVTYKR
jgi:hypothetical protein